MFTHVRSAFLCYFPFKPGKRRLGGYVSIVLSPDVQICLAALVSENAIPRTEELCLYIVLSVLHNAERKLTFHTDL